MKFASQVNDIPVNDPSLQQNQTDYVMKGYILKGTFQGVNDGLYNAKEWFN